MTQSVLQPVAVVQGQALVDAIRAEIISGALEPGQRLTEPALSRQYGVSRVPVREALRVLGAEGFIIFKPYGSASVQGLDERAAEEILTLRRLLEPHAAEEAARYRTREDLEELHEVLLAGEDVLKEVRIEATPSLNTRFHGGVARASHNSLLGAFMTQLQHKSEWVYSAAVSTRASYSWPEHWEIYDAIVRQDPPEASRIMLSHIQRTAVAATGAVSGSSER